jgi:flagellar hook-associated protein 1 FlgK
MVGGASPIAGATATINFTSDSGDYSWELRDGGGGLLSAGSATWTAGGSIPVTGTDINGFSMRLSGVPRNGDVITVLPTPPGAWAASNGNATALLALRDMGITGGRTPTESWSNALADIGLRVQGATSSATISKAVASQAEKLRANASGVNLDEEAARLIQYQQSYQAAAKMLQVAQTLFQQLMDVAGN